MVTASHNPAQDNGYKVYLGGRIVQDDGQGSQIVPPFDSEISQAIQSAPAAKDIPLADGGWQSFPFTIAADYSASVTQIARQFLPDQPNLGLKIVTTAMHGVGGAIQVQQLQSLGFVNLFEVAEQKDPDPDFPTIVFPNPEEAGALDMALDLARRSQADLIIANDPDADRCSIATFDPHGGDYRQWTGDEIGLLLGEFFAQQFRGQNVALASSIVSSRALAKIAAAHQIPYVPTLTGFKWISRVPRLIFGYEEAIGYNPDPEFVHDKDGPATGSIIAALASRPAPSSFNVPPRSLSVSTTLAGFLDEIARRYGLFTQSQVSVRLNSLDSINALVEQFRSRPPEKFGSETVTEVIDYANQPPSPALKTNGISFFTQEQSRIFVRPSGTEPKVKFYLETYRAIDPHCSFGALSNFRAAAREQHRQLSAALRALTKT
jgi:phosphomannomutase